MIFLNTAHYYSRYDICMYICYIIKFHLNICKDLINLKSRKRLKWLLLCFAIFHFGFRQSCLSLLPVGIQRSLAVADLGDWHCVIRAACHMPHATYLISHFALCDLIAGCPPIGGAHCPQPVASARCQLQWQLQLQCQCQWQ